jgi:hypothetical protein
MTLNSMQFCPMNSFGGTRGDDIRSELHVCSFGLRRVAGDDGVSRRPGGAENTREGKYMLKSGTLPLEFIWARQNGAHKGKKIYARNDSGSDWWVTLEYKMEGYNRIIPDAFSKMYYSSPEAVMSDWVGIPEEKIREAVSKMKLTQEWQEIKC